MADEDYNAGPMGPYPPIRDVSHLYPGAFDYKLPKLLQTATAKRSSPKSGFVGRVDGTET